MSPVHRAGEAEAGDLLTLRDAKRLSAVKTKLLSAVKTKPLSAVKITKKKHALAEGALKFTIGGKS